MSNLNTDELIDDFVSRVLAKCRPSITQVIGDNEETEPVIEAIALAVRETLREKPGTLPAPTPEMVAEARRAAQEKAEELGIGIEQVVAIGTPEGVTAIALCELDDLDA